MARRKVEKNSENLGMPNQPKATRKARKVTKRSADPCDRVLRSKAAPAIVKSLPKKTIRKQNSTKPEIAGKRESTTIADLAGATQRPEAKHEDALVILGAYLKRIKLPSEQDVLRERRVKLDVEDVEFLRGREALQRLGLEIQENMKKLVASQKATSSPTKKKDIQKDIEKVNCGGRALVQIGQKLAVQKERLKVERDLLDQDEAAFATKTAKSQPAMVNPPKSLGEMMMM